MRRDPFSDPIFKLRWLKNIFMKELESYASDIIIRWNQLYNPKLIFRIFSIFASKTKLKIRKFLKYLFNFNCKLLRRG